MAGRRPAVSELTAPVRKALRRPPVSSGVSVTMQHADAPPAVRPSARAYVVWAWALLAYAVAVFHRASLGVAAVEAQERFSAGASAVSLFLVLQLAVYAGAAGARRRGPGPVRLAPDDPRRRAHHGRRPARARPGHRRADRDRRAGAGRRRRRDDLHQRAAGRRRCGSPAAPSRWSPSSPASSGSSARSSRPIRWSPCCTARRWRTTFLGAAATGVLVAVLVLVALRDAPAGTPARRRAGLAEVRAQPRRHLAGARHPDRPVHPPGHPVLRHGLRAAVGLPVPGRGAGARRRRRRPALLTLLVRRRHGRRPAARPALRRAGRCAGRCWCSASSGPPSPSGPSSCCGPGRAPLPLLVVLVVVLGTNGPGSMIGFDYARTENPAERMGSASGVVNVGGFVASLLTILAVGAVLDLLTPGASTAYDLDAFRAAFAVQYVFWAVGLVGVLRHRRRAAGPAGPRRRRPRSAVRRGRRPPAGRLRLPLSRRSDGGSDAASATTHRVRGVEQPVVPRCPTPRRPGPAPSRLSTARAGAGRVSRVKPEPSVPQLRGRGPGCSPPGTCTTAVRRARSSDVRCAIARAGLPGSWHVLVEARRAPACSMARIRSNGPGSVQVDDVDVVHARVPARTCRRRCA